MAMVVEQPVATRTDRFFFTGMAVIATLIVFVGFAPTYYLRNPNLPVLSPLVQLHGVAFTSWMLLFVTQTTLVAAHRTDIHRRLGVVGAVLAATMAIVGIAAAIGLLRRGEGFGMDPRVFLALPLGGIPVFMILVTAGILLRRQSEAHKRLMLLATMSLLEPAIARFLQMPPAIFFLATDVFVAAPVVYDLWSRGRVHPALVSGALLIVIWPPLIFFSATSPAWLAFADLLR